MAGADVPPEFERHYIAEAWGCRPSEVDEEDENDVALQKIKMRVDAEHARRRDYFGKPPSGPG